jgi:hypothetical protein
MFCPKCAVENPDKARFCRQCGVEMRAVQEPTQQAPPPSTKRLGRFVGAAVLSAFGLIFLLAGFSGGDASAFVLAAPCLIGAYWLFSKK